ncbi:MAG: hypothetical protein ACE37F_24675 [Nannocystaceae bacterium]|nr:hypothetical protein [bacterium]
MDSLPLPLLVFLIVVAVVVGLWVGARANREPQKRRSEDKTLGQRARDGVMGGVVSVLRWNRDRKRKARARAKERSNDEG